MWIFTTHGFFSVVQHNQNPNMLIVRSRRRKHLDALKARYPRMLRRSKIVATPDADYPFRILVARNMWLRVAWELTWDIDYPNFKGAIDDRPGEPYREALHDVWDRMRQR